MNQWATRAEGWGIEGIRDEEASGACRAELQASTRK